MIVFLSTLLTPHQIPFCNEMDRLCDKFYFIQYKDVGDKWTSKNMVICKENYKYLLFWNEDRKYCEKVIEEADAVIAGGVKLKLLSKRLKAKKPTFIYLERFYKDGIKLKNILRVIGGTFIHHSIFQKYTPYLLCAGAYCAGDAEIFGNYRGRRLKWGYFPKMSDVGADYSTQKEENTVLWVGRLIDWKHPELLLQAAAELKKQDIACKIRIIGAGPMENALKEQIKEANLSDIAEICGEMPSEKVKEEMNKAAIFVTTSDYREGWGAVLNEAMDSECAVVASHAAGSTPYLVKNGKNGLIFESGNLLNLTECLVRLLKDKDYTAAIGKNAADYIRTAWSPSEAARRFIEKLGHIDEDLYKDGPLSIAEPIRQEEMYERCVME